MTTPGGFSSPVRWAGGGRDARGWIVALTDVLYVVGFHATAVIFLLAWKPLDSSSSSSSSSTSSLASPWSSLVIVVPLLVGETRLPNRVGKKNRPTSSFRVDSRFPLFFYLRCTLPWASLRPSQPPPTATAVDRRTVKRSTRSFALLSSFAGIKSVSLCRSSPSPLFRSRGLLVCSWQEVPTKNLEKVPAGPATFPGTRWALRFKSCEWPTSFTAASLPSNTRSPDNARLSCFDVIDHRLNGFRVAFC